MDVRESYDKIFFSKRFEWEELKGIQSERTVCYQLKDYYEYCVSHVTLDGLWLEFGVHSGCTVCLLAEYCKEIYGFDSFEGLPEDWVKSDYEVLKKGYFNMYGNTNLVRNKPKNVHLVKGWFNESLPPFLRVCKDKCAFIHIDCDLYSSTKTVLTLLKDRIVSGTIILFDELHGYANWANHEMKALVEEIDDYEYIAYSTQQAAIRVL